MKVEVYYGKNLDGLATLRLVVDGKEEISACPGEPEDFSLERALHFVYEIVPLMKRSWEAGKTGEPFSIIEDRE